MSKRNMTPKNFGPEFQLYLIEGTRDKVSDRHSYYFNVEDERKTFDEAMKSHDVTLWKESINDEMDSIMGNNTWVLVDLPPDCKPLGCKSSRLDKVIIKVLHEGHGKGRCYHCTLMDTSEKLRPDNGQALSQLQYSKVIGCLMYAMNYTRPDIAFLVGKLSRLIKTVEDSSSTNGWVFLLGGGVICHTPKLNSSGK
ncbi:hypothetical protein Tco_1375152, partial [Tanacetum coccineum]